jgi:hypothetical protein
MGLMSLPEFEVLHRTGGSQWFLWIMQHMGHSIHSHLQQGDMVISIRERVERRRETRREAEMTDLEI